MSMTATKTIRRTIAGRRGLVLALAFGAAVAGCATTKPYERERLSRRDMRLERDGDVGAGQEHAAAYREGATGAVGSSGGGCGCN